jgi:GMP synthase-like glutamine amidotransferase
MQPIAIFRAARTEGPGYFASYLERKSIAWRLVKLDEGEAVPHDARRFSGLAFMGGPMSVNDELPWIIPVLELIRDAARKDVPVIGHCLGGQLMSKAFGGTVRANPVKEIGWGEVRVADNAVARGWLAGVQAFKSFHWHGETFSIPPGATRILEGGRKSPAVQRPQDIERDLPGRLGELNEIATRLYDRWTEGLARG